MAQLPTVQNNSTSSTSGTDASTAANASLNDLDVDSFLKIMIAELQNQDPLSPMDSSQMLDQIGQMRQITASDQLTSTLKSVLLGQNIASSTNLIGASINGISDDSQKVSGVVSSVSIDNGAPKLHLSLRTSAEVGDTKGDMSQGKYSYRVVWQGDDGKLQGIELSNTQAVTTDASGESIQISNLPGNTGPKAVYRTDATGGGSYEYVGTITDGDQSTFSDTTADNARNSSLTQGDGFTDLTANSIRDFIVSLNNVGSISPPDLP
ncbi:MAG TPA: flagellar hook capping FlgD N-terminal domain-containing protein [Lacipirellulaceae bacterium]|jgi:flagellar basal-body rod modification protein FlgD